MKDISFYILMDNRIDSIVKYAEDHREYYSLNEYTVESVKVMIKASAKEIFDEKNYDSFRKCIDALAKREHRALSRTNIFKLCYALKIDSLGSATEFLERYLGVNPLSPRVLEEFVIIAGYKLNLTWKEVNEITRSAEDIIGSVPPSPRVLTDGDTQSMAEDIDKKIHSVSDLKKYITTELTNSFFARTRNTQYMAFFNYMDWETYMDWEKDNPDKEVSDFILGTWDNDTLENRHLRTFSFENEDEDEYTDTSYGDHLTSADIETLSRVFPNTFLSYETYRHLMLRERNEPISSETMLIVLMNDVNPDNVWNDISSDSWEYELYQNQSLDFTNEDEFKKNMNFFLENAGCAHLNYTVGFERLILDALHDTIEENQASIENGTCGSSELKSLLFAKLRSVFKKIATDYMK